MEVTANTIVAALGAVVTAIGGPMSIKSAWVGYQDWLAAKDAAKQSAYDTAMAAKDAELIGLRSKVETKDAELRHVSDAAVAKVENWLERVLTSMDQNTDEVKRLVERLNGGKP